MPSISHFPTMQGMRYFKFQQFYKRCWERTVTTNAMMTSQRVCNKGNAAGLQENRNNRSNPCTICRTRNLVKCICSTQVVDCSPCRKKNLPKCGCPPPPPTNSCTTCIKLNLKKCICSLPALNCSPCQKKNLPKCACPPPPTPTVSCTVCREVRCICSLQSLDCGHCKGLGMKKCVCSIGCDAEETFTKLRELVEKQSTPKKICSVPETSTRDLLVYHINYR